MGVNFYKVSYFVGVIVAILAGTMLLPTPVAFFYGDRTAPFFLLSAALTGGLAAGLIGLGLWKSGHNQVSHREGMAVVGLAWPAIGFLGALPYWFTGSITGFWDAIFESVSGFSTTGATVIMNVAYLPKSVIFWRSLSHWLGGMGIVLLMLAILPFLGLGGMQMFRREVSGPKVDKLAPRLTQTAKILWGVYLGFTVILIVLLLFGGMSLFDAVCHAFSTISTGGFSSRDSSVAFFGRPYLEVVLTIFMVICGINFSFYYLALGGHWRSLVKNPEVRFYLAIFAVISLAVALVLIYYGNYGPLHSLRMAAFQTASVITTTGFATADWESWPRLAQGLLALLFFVGGCSGSTSGGVKCIRVLLLFKSAHRLLRQAIHPRAVIKVRLGGENVPEPLLAATWAFLGIYVTALALSTLGLAALNLDLETAFTGSASCLGNVGPALGSIGPMGVYGHLPGPAKGILSLGMFLGRLEYFAILVLFLPEFWKK